MNSPTPPAQGIQSAFFLFRNYRLKTGRPLLPWLVLAVLNLATQIVFHRELSPNPGEFGCLNTALGAIGLSLVPLLALREALSRYFALEHEPERYEQFRALRLHALSIIETAALGWGLLLVPLLAVLLPLLGLPRFSIQLFTLLAVFAAIGALISSVASVRKRRVWSALLIGAAVARLLAGAFITHDEPWAESGLTAFCIAGLITLTPALNPHENARDWRKAWKALCDRDFFLHFSTTFSVVLANFLFISADRIVALSRFGNTSNNLGYVDLGLFDGYQAAGLCARALLWGTQPLLLLFYAERSRLTKTTAASLRYFWVYLVVLAVGAAALLLVSPFLCHLFSANADDYHHMYLFLPGFVLTMLPLGLLQGLGVFALASHRRPECFVLGGSSLGYLLLLWFFGQPYLMLTFMLGGAIISLMLVLFIGVVRWGRRQP